MRRMAECVYIEYWVVRVVRDTKTCKTVVKEIEFETPPTEQDIIEILLKCDPNEFISIEHNYRMGKGMTNRSEDKSKQDKDYHEEAWWQNLGYDIEQMADDWGCTIECIAERANQLWEEKGESKWQMN